MIILKKTHQRTVAYKDDTIGILLDQMDIMKTVISKQKDLLRSQSAELKVIYEEADNYYKAAEGTAKQLDDTEFLIETLKESIRDWGY